MWLVVAAVQILNNIITCEAFIPTNPVVVGVRRVQTSKVFGGGLQFPATQCIYVLHLHPEDTIDETAAAMRQVLEGAGHQPLAVVAFHGTPQVRRASGVAWVDKPQPVLEAAVDVAFATESLARNALLFVKASSQFPARVSAGSCAVAETPVRNVFDLRTYAWQGVDRVRVLCLFPRFPVSF